MTLVLTLFTTPVLAAGDSILIENVTYFDVHTRTYKYADSILVHAGIITHIGALPSTIDKTTQRIDARGKFLFPGFIDTHAHVTVLELGEPPSLTRMNKLNPKATLEMLTRCLDFGITTVRNPASPTTYGIALREQVQRGEIEGPRILTAGSAIQFSKGQRQVDESNLFIYVHDSASLITKIDRQADAGVDCIKLYNLMTPDLVATAVKHGRKIGMPIVAHLDKTSWLEGAKSGLQSHCHFCSWSPGELEPDVRREYLRRAARVDGMLKRLDWLELLDVDGPVITRLLSALKENSVIVDATLIAYETKFKGVDPFYIESKDLAFAPVTLLDQWRRFTFTKNWKAADYARGHAAWPKVLHLARRMFEAGVITTIGSDTPNPWVVPGAGWHRELAIMVEAGIPAAEVMRMATWNGAALLRMEDRIGSIEIGKDADLVLLTADPLADIANSRKIAHVFQQGRIIRTNPVTVTKTAR